jgi:hypothetical protein
MIGPGDRGLVGFRGDLDHGPGGRDVKLTTFSLPPRTTSWPARSAVYQWPFFRPDDVSTLGRGGSYMANRYAAKIRGVPAADRAVTIGCRIKPGRPELIGAPRTAVTRPAVYRRSPQADRRLAATTGSMLRSYRRGRGQWSPERGIWRCS